MLVCKGLWPTGGVFHSIDMPEALLGAALIAGGIISGVHALMTKRDPRSTAVWAVLCILVPAAGAALYWIFGVNRIRTRARLWQAHGRFSLTGERNYGGAETPLEHQHPARAETMDALVRIAERVTRRPLLRGNKVERLHNGEEAYPVMLEAIASAKTSIYLQTYIFDTDAAGQRFIAALAAAAGRGVDVHVLIDGIGERYCRPRASKLLRKHAGVEVALFLPPALSMRGLSVNLRNHRKLLMVDSHIGFTGGMNIGQRHMVQDPKNRKLTADLHFRVCGPVVLAMEEVFFEDWRFATGEDLGARHRERPAVEPAGPALCRAISDGPNEDFEVLTWLLVGALSTARSRIQIMTPYFIPSRELLSALNAAALRGVEVDVLLPRRNNLPFVAWAAQAMLDEVMQYGTRIYYQPAPFNHTKLLVVDEFYVVLGSANLDPRSLRLNFEFNLEVYDPELGHTLSQECDQIRARSHLVTLEELRARNPVIKFRDSLAKLFSPYL